MRQRANPLPSKVRVGPYTYRVTRPKTLYSDDGSEKLWGSIKHDPEQHIRICREAPDERAWTTLIHESLHAIDDLATLGLTEEQITRLAPAIFAFLIDNDFSLPNPD